MNSESHDPGLHSTCLGPMTKHVTLYLDSGTTYAPNSPAPFLNRLVTFPARFATRPRSASNFGRELRLANWTLSFSLPIPLSCFAPLSIERSFQPTMSLLQYPPPVDYASQTTGFKEFLKGFKSFQSNSEAAATEALQDLNIDEGRTSDEYDFMDDADEMDGATSRPTKRQNPKFKYMQILQDVANRDTSHIQIDLDDLETVSTEHTANYRIAAHPLSSLKSLCLRAKTSSLSNPLKKMHTTMSTLSPQLLTNSCPSQQKMSRKSH